MSNKIENLEPILKWAGGKRQLLPEINARLPKLEEGFTYYEPFIGGGAVLLDMQPKSAVINDFNEELINVYEVVKNNIEELIKELSKHKNEKEYYYEIRAWDRDFELYESLTDVQKAARLLYINKTCFNGLHRVNSKGQFNVPFANYKNPNILNEERLRALNEYLNQNNIKFLSEDFEIAVEGTKDGDFVYFDPPYAPISETSSFTSYSTSDFNEDAQIRLANVAEHLKKKGVYVMLSNNDTDLIRNIYHPSIFNIHEITSMRSIGAKSKSRGRLQELLITTY